MQAEDFTPGATVAQLQRQIVDLTDRLNAGRASHLSVLPVIKSTSPGHDQDCHELVQQLQAAVRTKFVAQTHVILRSFTDVHALLVDFDRERVNVPYTTGPVEIALDKIVDYWLDFGHKPENRQPIPINSKT